MRKIYSAELEGFFKEFYEAGHTIRETARAVSERFGIDMTYAKAHNFATHHGFKNGLKNGIPKGVPTKLFPAEVGEYIRKNCKGVAPAKMAEKLNGTFGTVYTARQIAGYYKKHGLKSGIDRRFKKGNVPLNPLDGTHPKSVATRFKAGHTPANRTPIGTVRRRADGYLWRKVGKGCLEWRPEHVLRWEETFGPVPDGCVITFADGDRGNCNVSNLRCVSKAVNGVLNRKGLRRDDPETTDAEIKIAELLIAINDRKGRKK